MTDPMQRAARGGGGPRKIARRAGTAQSTEPSLFDVEADEGRRRRDDGMRVAEHASHPWVKTAIDRAIRERARSRQPFTSDDVRAEVELLASSTGLLGARINAASRRGEIVKTGRYLQSRNASRHGGVVAEWIGAGGDPS